MFNYYEFSDEELTSNIFKGTEDILLEDLKNAIKMSFDIDIHLTILFLMILKKSHSNIYNKLTTIYTHKEIYDMMKRDLKYFSLKIIDDKVSDENIYKFLYQVVSKLRWECSYFIINAFENSGIDFFENNDILDIKKMLDKKMN